MKKFLLAISFSVFSTWAIAQCLVTTIPNATNNSGECYINDLTVDANVISAGSGFQPTGTSYQMFATPYITVRQGEMSWFDLSVTHSSFYTVYAWIDYNNDGIYASTEIAFYDPGANSSFISFGAMLPGNALPDTVRMRITIQQGAGPWGPGADDACEAPGVGETEDYMVIIECPIVQPLSFDPAPVICHYDSVLLSGFSTADIAWYLGSPATYQGMGQSFFLHTPVGTTDTMVYLQFASPGCFSAPLDSMLVTFLPSPIASILGPDTIQSCSTVTVSAVSGPYNYSWSNGDTGSTIIISTGFGGPLGLNVVAPNGCSNSDEIFVQVAPDPPATYANIYAGPNYCTSLEILLFYDSLIAPGACTWYTYPGNTLVGSGSQVLYTLPDTGTYQFLAVVNSVCGTDSIIRTIEGYYGVRYDSMYVLNATLNGNIYMYCYSNTGYITGILSGLQGTVVEWVLTDITLGFTLTWNDDDTLDIPSSLSTNGHIYSVFAIVENAMGCADSTETVLMMPYNTMNFNLADTSWLCSFPNTFGFGSVNYAVYDLLWSTGDTTNTIPVSGPMGVTLYAIDNNTGCVTYDTTYIGDASSQADMFDDTTYVCNTEAYFDAQMIQYNVDFWEEYDLNWSLLGSGNNYDYMVFGSNDAYLVFAGYNSHNCYIRDTTYISFNSSFSFSLGPDISTMTTPVTLTGPSGVGFTYSWAPQFSGNQSIQVNTSGTYTLTVNNGQGCTYQDAIVVTILPTSVTQENAAVSINVFPNPASDQITVQSTAEISVVTIYDLDGRLVLAKVCNNTQTEINIAELPAGCYILEAVTEEGISRSRLVKQ